MSVPPEIPAGPAYDGLRALWRKHVTEPQRALAAAKRVADAATLRPCVGARCSEGAWLRRTHTRVEPMRGDCGGRR